MPRAKQGRSAALVIAAGVVAAMTFLVLWHLLIAYQFGRLSSPEPYAFHEVGTALESYQRLFPLLILVCAAVIAGGAMVLIRRGGEGSRLAIAAVAALFVWQTMAMWSWIASVFEVGQGALETLWFNPWGRLIATAVTYGGLALAGAAALSTRGRAGSKTGLALYIALVGGACLATVLRAIFGDPRSGQLIFGTLNQLPLAAGGVVLLRSLLRRGPEVAEDAEDAEDGSGAADTDPQWARVASGLGTYRAALLWRMITAVGGSAILVLAAVAGSMGTLLGVAVPAISLAFSLMMLHGIYHYADQPDTSPARSTAWLSFALLAVVTCLEGYSLVLLFDIHGVNPLDSAAAPSAFDAMEEAHMLAAWALGLGFASLLLLQVSLRQLATHLGRGDLAREVDTVALVTLASGALVTWFRTYLPGASDGGEVIALGAICLVGVITAVVLYLRLLRRFERALRAGKAPDSLAQARVL